LKTNDDGITFLLLNELTMTYDELQCFHYDFDLLTLLLKAMALTLIFFY